MAGMIYRCLICGSLAPTFVACADHVLDSHGADSGRTPDPSVDPDYYVDPWPSEGACGR